MRPRGGPGAGRRDRAPGAELVLGAERLRGRRGTGHASAAPGPGEERLGGTGGTGRFGRDTVSPRSGHVPGVERPRSGAAAPGYALAGRSSPAEFSAAGVTSPGRSLRFRLRDSTRASRSSPASAGGCRGRSRTDSVPPRRRHVAALRRSTIRKGESVACRITRAPSSPVPGRPGVSGRFDAAGALDVSGAPTFLSVPDGQQSSRRSMPGEPLTRSHRGRPRTIDGRTACHEGDRPRGGPAWCVRSISVVVSPLAWDRSGSHRLVQRFSGSPGGARRVRRPRRASGPSRPDARAATSGPPRRRAGRGRSAAPRRAGRSSECAVRR